MGYGLELVTPAVGEPISLAEAKLFCRVPQDVTIEDGLILDLIGAARRYVEQWLDITLISCQRRLSLDRFPSLFWIGSWGNSYQDYQGYQGPSQGAGQGNWQWTLDGKTIRMPYPPLQNVTSLSYIDTSGAQNGLACTTISASISPGTQTVTPLSMLGIQAGQPLLIDVRNNQEKVVVASVTATTFTATFALAHAGPVIVNGFQQVTNKPVGFLSPIYGLTWPIAQAQLDAIKIDFWCGYGPATFSAVEIPAGLQTVTPVSMAGIFVGTQLIIEPGTVRKETVVVTGVTATTFTATFAQDHGGAQAGGTLPVAIGPSLPETLRQALRLLINHSFVERQPLVIGSISKEMERSVAALLYSEWSGEYCGA